LSKRGSQDQKRVNIGRGGKEEEVRSRRGGDRSDLWKGGGWGKTDNTGNVVVPQTYQHKALRKVQPPGPPKKTIAKTK